MEELGVCGQSLEILKFPKLSAITPRYFSSCLLFVSSNTHFLYSPLSENSISKKHELLTGLCQCLSILTLPFPT